MFVDNPRTEPQKSLWFWNLWGLSAVWSFTAICIYFKVPDVCGDFHVLAVKSTDLVSYTLRQWNGFWEIWSLLESAVSPLAFQLFLQCNISLKGFSCDFAKGRNAPSMQWQTAAGGGGWCAASSWKGASLIRDGCWFKETFLWCRIRRIFHLMYW